MEKIFDNQFLTFDLDGRRKILYYTWKNTSKDLTEEQIFEQARLVLNTVLANKCRYIVGDTRQFLVAISPELQDVLNKEIFDNIGEIIHKFAHIVNQDKKIQTRLEETYEESDFVMFQNQFFDDLDDANAWIYESAR